jgi:hypothetical protein
MSGVALQTVFAKHGGGTSSIARVPLPIGLASALGVARHTCDGVRLARSVTYSLQILSDRTESLAETALRIQATSRIAGVI